MISLSLTSTCICAALLIDDANTLSFYTTELFRSPIPNCGTPCSMMSRRCRHWLFLGNSWRLISSIVPSPNQCSSCTVTSSFWTLVDSFTYLIRQFGINACPTHIHSMIDLQQWLAYLYSEVVFIQRIVSCKCNITITTACDLSRDVATEKAVPIKHGGTLCSLNMISIVLLISIWWPPQP